MKERSTHHKRHSPSSRDKLKEWLTGLWLMVHKHFTNGLVSSSVMSNACCSQWALHPYRCHQHYQCPLHHVPNVLCVQQDHGEEEVMPGGISRSPPGGCDASGCNSASQSTLATAGAPYSIPSAPRVAIFNLKHQTCPLFPRLQSDPEKTQ